MELQYELTSKELEEALLCLEIKHEGIKKRFHIGGLSLAAVIGLLHYWWQPQQFFYLLLTALAVFLLFALLYGPLLRRRRQAQKMLEKGRIYKITVPSKEIEKGYESKQVFTIQTETETYCIPKRILTTGQLSEVRKIIEEHAAETYRIVS